MKGRIDAPRRGIERVALRIATVVLLSTSAAMPADAAEHEIQAIRQRGHELMFFEPAFLRVEPGDRVTFVVDDLDHRPRSVFVPEGAEGWAAVQGRSVTVDVDIPGVYVFECAFHNVMGMVGVLVVGEPANTQEAGKFLSRYQVATIRINQVRADRLLRRLEEP